VPRLDGAFDAVPGDDLVFIRYRTGFQGDQGVEDLVRRSRDLAGIDARGVVNEVNVVLQVVQHKCAFHTGFLVIPGELRPFHDGRGDLRRPTAECRTKQEAEQGE